MKNKAVICKIIEALKDIHKESNSGANIDFFEKLPMKIMEDYERNLEKHILNR